MVISFRLIGGMQAELEDISGKKMINMWIKKDEGKLL